MGSMASQITSLTIVYSTVYSDADQRKQQKLRVAGLCAGNSPGTGEFRAQMASNAENVSIWWRHHDFINVIRWPLKANVVTELSLSRFNSLLVLIFSRLLCVCVCHILMIQELQDAI